MEFKELKQKLIISRAERDKIASDISKRKLALRKLNRQVEDFEEARLIIQEVSKRTQQEWESRISEVVSLAIASVFDDPYEFRVEFCIKRGKTEADLFFYKDGEKFNPLDDAGGGVVDIASFALRIAAWALPSPQKRTRNCIILDEPFKYLSMEGDFQRKAGEMLSLLSKQLNIQFIMVTHNPELIKASDKVIEIRQKTGVSYVNVV